MSPEAFGERAANKPESVSKSSEGRGRNNLFSGSRIQVAAGQIPKISSLRKKAKDF
jgi:hypothetical protein